MITFERRGFSFGAFFMLLSAENIHKQYGHHKALNGVSIEIPKGAIFGLLGPNGAGKTTLIRIINHIVSKDSGSLLFNQHPMKVDDVYQIGYLPEERGLYRKMKVAEQALYLASLKGVPKKIAKERLITWLEKFDMLPWAQKKVEDLSKGMQQKIQFIVTLLHKPELLILDEPFSGFDPVNTNLVKKEILKLKESGTTIIFSTHNMASVEEVCDSIALINKAEKVLDGNVNEIKSSYAKSRVEVTFRGNLIAFTNALWTNFELIEKEQKDEVISARVKLGKNLNLNQLLQAIIPHVEVLGARELLPSMNDIFIDMVEEKAEGHE